MRGRLGELHGACMYSSKIVTPQQQYLPGGHKHRLEWLSWVSILQLTAHLAAAALCHEPHSCHVSTMGCCRPGTERFETVPSTPCLVQTIMVQRVTLCTWFMHH